MQKAGLPKTALVTGGSSGIGLAIAKKFSQNKIKVAVADLQELSDNRSREKQDMLYKYCDVSKAGDIDDLYAWTVENLGHPEILVVSAGLGIREKLAEGDPEKWEKIISTNIMGALRCIRAFTPHMLKQEKGHVIIISSVAAGKPHPYGGIYSASKTALDVIAETLRLETLPHIKVTTVSPGITDTGFFSNQLAGNHSIDDLGMGAIPPEEIAEDVFYAVNKKSGTCISQIVTRPTAQSF